MKSIPCIALILLTAIGSGIAAAASDRPNGAPAFGGGSEFSGTLMRAARQLDLTDNQKQAIRDLMKNARQQAASTRTAQPYDMTVLGDPGNTSYAAAVENAQTQAVQRVQKASELQQQIYNLLTPEQKSQLPKVLADLKAEREARRAERQQRQNRGS